ncbi:MAG: hypothetical protein JST16_12650 [Bdellovibrionales bacterium]|nr:hypothetical protein [Bdellovibrionales bacterium]
MNSDSLNPVREPLLNEEFRRLIHVVCEGVGEFRHFDVCKIALSLTTSKSSGRHGVWAHVIPLRYVGGGATRRGRRWGMVGSYSYESPQVLAHYPEATYLMTFMIPRFFILKPLERLETVVHELYHLHPTLRGDLRRFARPHMHHGPTPALYDRKVKSMAQEALRTFPELLQHSLLAGDGSAYATRKRLRLARPQQIFRPDPSVVTGLSRWARSLLGVLLLVGAASAHAVSVRTLRGGSLYANPSMKSQVVSTYAEDARFQALRSSPNKIWIQVKSAEGTGWIPRQWVRADSPASKENQKSLARGPKAPSSGEPVGEETFTDMGEGSEAKLEGELREYDSQSDKFFAAQAGRLFEKPSSMSARFGVVEAGDEFKVFKREGAWTQVRLVITGEDGWYPTKSIRRVQEDRIRSVGVNVVEGALGWGSKGLGYGLDAGYFRNLMTGGTDGRPRDRLELGGSLGLWTGQSVTLDSKSASTKVYQFMVIGRYLGSSPDGRISGGAEFGLDYKKSTLTTSGFTDTDIESELADSAASTSIGLLLGVVGFYSFNESWHAMLGARAHIASSPIAWIRGGVDFRF